jgi:hypothetical protein
MHLQNLQDSYRDLLVKAGVNCRKAETISKDLTLDDLRIICDIWPEWENIYLRPDYRVPNC